MPRSFPPHSFGKPISLGKVRRQPWPGQKAYQILYSTCFCKPAWPWALNVIRAGHVIAAQIADQLAPARFEPLRAHGTIARSVVLRQLRRGGTGVRPRRTRRRSGLLHGMFHGGHGYSTTSRPGDRGAGDGSRDERSLAIRRRQRGGTSQAPFGASKYPSPDIREVPRIPIPRPRSG